MQVKQFVVSLNSEKPERLIAFYRDTIGLTVVEEVAPGAFQMGSATSISLIIEGHSEVLGAAKEPKRVLLNFVVDGIASEHARLLDAGVEFLVSMEEEAGFGLISTFLDPDGNYCQLIELQG